MTFSLRTMALTADRGSNRVIHEVTVDIAASCWTGVIGANGSGKTTLLKVLAGRLPQAAGAILLGDAQQGSSRLHRAARVGFAPEASILPGSLTGGELLTIMAEDRPSDPAPLAVLRNALEIDRLKGLRISAMSAGMRQRIAIFAAFVRETDVVILDEPFNWLDPVCTFDVKVALRKIVDGCGLSLVTALHDFGTLTSYCDNGVVLADGRLVRTIAHEELREGRLNLARFEAQLIADLRSKEGAPIPVTRNLTSSETKDSGLAVSAYVIG